MRFVCIYVRQSPAPMRLSIFSLALAAGACAGPVPGGDGTGLPMPPEPTHDIAFLVADAPRDFAAVRGAPDTTLQLIGGRLEDVYRSPLAADSVREAVVWVQRSGDQTLSATYRVLVGRNRYADDVMPAERSAVEAANEGVAMALDIEAGAALATWERNERFGAVVFRECPGAFGRSVEISTPSEGVRLTIERGQRPCLPASERALLAAARDGDAAALRSALDAGASPDTWNEMAESALALAVGGDHEGAARLLLDAGADPDGPDLPDDEVGETPISQARTAATLRLLLDAGADPDAVGTSTVPALVGATLDRDTDRVRLLLNAGADPNRSAGMLDGQTALHFAVLESAEIAQMLLDAGADPNARSSLGYTPLNVLAGSTDGEGPDTVAMARLLLATGADPNLASRTDNSYGWTPLMEAARTGHAAFVRFLLTLDRVDRAARSTEGETALAAARSHGEDETAAILEAAGVPE